MDVPGLWGRSLTLTPSCITVSPLHMQGSSSDEVTASPFCQEVKCPSIDNAVSSITVLTAQVPRSQHSDSKAFSSLSLPACLPGLACALWPTNVRTE